MRCSLSSARQIPEALRLLEQAIARDPHYGPALAWAALCCFRLVLDGRSEDPASRPSEGHRFRTARPGSGRRRPGHLGECRPRAGLFRRGHRRHDGVGRPGPGAQPELRARMAHQQVSQVWAGQPDIAIEHIETALRLSPRARIGTSLLTHRRRAFLQPALRSGGAEAAPRDPGGSELSARYRFLAACYAHMGRLDDARDGRRAAAGHHLCRDTGRQLPAERRAPRAFPLGPAPGGRRDGMIAHPLNIPYFITG